jgi:UDP-N-acetylmuramoyl-tripeptide--D-alanyl-D-alanine ligase
MRFTLNNIIQATKGRLLHASAFEDELHTIATDSRALPSRGSAEPHLFWAIRGDSFDGHDFVSASLENGADAVLVDETFASKHPLDEHTTTIVVPDTLRALSDLASWHARRSDAKIVGVTGSFGKTTTRQLISAALSGSMPCVQSPSNFNNQYGVPLSLLGIEPKHQAAIIEFGASAVGEIAALCEIAQPTIGAITGIGKAHVARFGCLANTVTAKKELAHAIPKDGLLLLPGDSRFCEQLGDQIACSNVVRVGTNSDRNDVSPAQVNSLNGSLCVTVDNTSFHVQAAGRHFVQPILVAIAIARHFGLQDKDIAMGLAQFTPTQGRCQVKEVGNWTVIDDTYNASPEAVIAACRLLGQWQTSGPRILVSGDMLELGTEVISCHEEIGIAAAENGLDHVLAFGEHGQVVAKTCIDAGLSADSARAFSSIKTLTQHLKTLLVDGATILVKGSRGIHMERVVSAIESIRMNELKKVGTDIMKIE